MAAAGWISATIDIVKFVGGPIFSYLKNQYQFNAKLEDFNSHRQALHQRREKIQLKLESELRIGRKIARSDVETWLTAAGAEIARQSVVEEVSQSGCLSSRFRRTGILKRRIVDVIRVYDQGETYSQEDCSLVVDDYSKILEDNVKIFREQKEKLHDKLQDVRETLRSQLVTSWKTEKKQVMFWQNQVEEITGSVARDVEDKVRNPDPSDHAFLANLVHEMIQKIDKLHIEGGQLPESLVIDDYSRNLDDKMKTFGELKKKLQGKLQDVRETLRSQLVSWTTEKKQVMFWQNQVEEITGSVARDVEDKVRNSDPSEHAYLANLVHEMIQKMDKLHVEGGQLPESLVIDDCSRILEDNVKIFREQKEKLQGKLQDVRETLRSQLVTSWKTEKKQVRFWHNQVEEMTGSVARDVEDKVRNPDPSDHASLANLVHEMIQKMDKLHIEGDQLPETLVVDGPSTSAPELPTSELQGSSAIKAEILACLMGDEVRKVGVWGMGGVGKTTIMEHVYNQLQKESKFNKVIWITVSQTFDIHQIQQKIAVDLKKEEELSRIQERVIRAATLSNMLEKHKPYTMILDDVWESFELKDVGIPEPLVNDGCKLVLTMRSKEIARMMDCKPIEVKTLSSEESLTLFKDKVGTLSCGRHVEGTLKLIVDECGGLPLAIKTIAGSLKGITDSRLWSAALNQLKEGKKSDAFSKLKFSYDWLKDETIKKCFLHCAMYPEDCKILKEELVEYWIAEELIEVMHTRQAMIYEGYDILRKLEENSLLEPIEDRSKIACVRMHDLVRDMAIQIIKSLSTRVLIKAGIGLRELPEEHEWEEDLIKVSLISNKIEEIPSSMSFTKCSRLTTLLLSGNNFSVIPELFFEHMPKLRILDLSNSYRLCSLPSSISKLVDLTTLLLRYCTELKKVPSLCNLRALKKLDLFMTRLEEVPQGLEMLTSINYLDLDTRSIQMYRRLAHEREILMSNMISNLSKLQYLSLRVDMQVKGEVLRRLAMLEAFSGQFPTTQDMVSFFKCRRVNLYQYNIVAGTHNFPASDMKLKKSICFCGLYLYGEPNLLPPDVQHLRIETCNDVRSLNDVSGFQDATGLCKCHISYCKGMEYVFSRVNRFTEVLEELSLRNLENLNGIFEPQLAVGKKSVPPLGTFSFLVKLHIYGCPKVKKLLPITMNLQNLEDIRVEKCEHLEEIMIVSEERATGIFRVILPKLKKLRLSNLPMLKSIYSLTVVLVCDSLEHLEIVECPNLNMEYLFGQQFNPLQTLEYLCLGDVINLKSLFDEEAGESLALWTPPPATGSFPLQHIISSSSQEEEESPKIIHLPKLKYLTLDNLLTLKRVCSSTSMLICDSLNDLSIIDCKQMKRVPWHLPQLDNGKLSPPPLLKIELSTKEKDWWESLEWDQPEAKNVVSPLCIFLDEENLKMNRPFRKIRYQQ